MPDLGEEYILPNLSGKYALPSFSGDSLVHQRWKHIGIRKKNLHCIPVWIFFLISPKIVSFVNTWCVSPISSHTFLYHMKYLHLKKTCSPCRTENYCRWEVAGLVGPEYKKVDLIWSYNIFPEMIVDLTKCHNWSYKGMDIFRSYWVSEITQLKQKNWLMGLKWRMGESYKNDY